MTNASSSGTFSLGGDLPVHRLGFGTMRITGKGVWGPPRDRDEALRATALVFTCKAMCTRQLPCT